MGMIDDFLTHSIGIDHDAPTTPLDRRVSRELRAIEAEGDMALKAVWAGADEVQTLAAYVPTVSGGTFILHFKLANHEHFQSGILGHDNNAATIETAIDVEATAASITGWTNGDISIALGTDLTAGPMTITYDGASVAKQNHPLFKVTGTLTGGGSFGARSETTIGAMPRRGYGLLFELGIVIGSVPAIGAVPTDLVQSSDPSQRRLSAETIREIATEIARDEGNADIYDAIVLAAGV